VRPRGATLEDCVAQRKLSIAPLALDGRGGRRLAALVGLVTALAAEI